MTQSTFRLRLALLSLLLVPVVAMPAGGHPDRPASGPIQLADADTSSPGRGPAIAGHQLDPTDAYRLALLKIKGHLGVARALLRVRAPGAAYHLGEPVRRIYESARPQLNDRNAPLTDDVLVQLERATDASPGAALATIDIAAAAVDGSFAQAGAMRARSSLLLSEQLLREAVRLYTDAVTDNEVVDLRAYRTGRGYVTQAEALIRHSSGIKGQPGHDTLLAAVVLVRQAWPGIRPPPIVFDPQSVAGRLDEAVAALHELGE